MKGKPNRQRENKNKKQPPQQKNTENKMKHNKNNKTEKLREQTQSQGNKREHSSEGQRAPGYICGFGVAI